MIAQIKKEKLNKIVLAMLALAFFTACANENTKLANELTFGKDEQAIQLLIAQKIDTIHALQKVEEGHKKIIQDLEKEVATLKTTNQKIEYELDNMNTTIPEDVEKTTKKIVELTR